MSSKRIAPSLLLLAGAACSSATEPHPAPDATVPPDATVEVSSYFRDAKALIDARCGECHRAGGIGAMPLTTFEEISAVLTEVRSEIEAGTMPPWIPEGQCASYHNTPTLTADERAKLLAWIDSGAARGSPEDEPAALPPLPGLSRVDRSLAVEPEYAPHAGDDLRCFLAPWDEAAPRYLTGYNVRPSRAGLLRHVNLYAIPPASVAAYRDRDAQDPASGFDCGAREAGERGVTFLGAWTPGSNGTDFPADTGILIEGGSALMMEVHYLTANEQVGQTDRPTLEVRIEEQVAKRAGIVAFYDFFAWPQPGGMLIPAGQREVVHHFEFDPTPVRSAFFPWIQDTNQLAVHGVGMHMHRLGSGGRVEIRRPDSDCLFSTARWDVDWVGGYILDRPRPFELGRDRLYLECRYDNSPEHQPWVNGQQQPPRDVQWGTRADDENCIGLIYVTAG